MEQIFKYHNILTRMKTLVLAILGVLLTMSENKPIYDFKKSYVVQLTNFNFKDQILKIRQNTNGVSVVHFYKWSDGKSRDMVKAMDEWTNEMNGVFKIGSVDCDEYAALCTTQGVTEFPLIKIYPPNPQPIKTVTDNFSTQNLQKIASKYLHSNVIEITNNNLNTFVGENPSVPKVLLFSDKKGVPMVYKGLSVAFEKKLNFGIVRNSEDALVSKYNIKKFPTLLVVKTGEKKPFEYKGKEFNFKELFTFLNIYSEVFVPGGGSSLDSSATKQWMTESVPEMTARSARDICLATESTLCVILLTTEKPLKETKTIFEELAVKYERKIDRGNKFKFMWLNADVEKEWGKIFNYESKNEIIILNPGKRKRFMRHEGDITKDNIIMTLQTIVSGNARFNRLADTLPPFQIRTN